MMNINMSTAFFILNPLTGEYESQQVLIDIVCPSLGSGGQGTVCKAKYQNQLVALKRSNTIPSLFNQLTSLDHPSLVKVIDVGTTFNLFGSPLYITIMEMAQSVDFENLSSQETLYLLIDILEGLSYLHQKGLTHCDVKPQNIVQVYRHEKGRVAYALCDFDSIHPIHDLQKTLIGTAPFLSPKSIRKNSSNFYDNDIWALGVTLYYIMKSGESIWTTVNSNCELAQVILEIGSHYEKIIDIQLPNQMSEIEELIYNIIKRCLDQRNPPTVDQLIAELNHPFFMEF